jgi:hypothetical protein
VQRRAARRDGGAGPYPDGSLTRLYIEVALASGLSLTELYELGEQGLVTVIDVLEKRNEREA